MQQGNIVVVCAPGGDAREAERLAEKIGVPLVGKKDNADAAKAGAVGASAQHADAFAQDERSAPTPGADAGGGGAVLTVRFAADGVSLRADGMTLRVDLAEALPRLTPGKLQRELLVKAARIKGAAAPVAVDATAGLGGDSLLLAAAGFTVYMYEQGPVIAALLRDALRRAAADPRLVPITSRMHLTEGDSLEVLAHLPEPPDVVYLDPMFPERRKSAAVKKRFQLLHHLERPCANQEAMLQAALLARPRKVVVKRPAKGPYLADAKPSYSVSGKAVRYDVIIPPQGA